MNEVHPINEEAWGEWVEWRHKEKKIKIGPVAEKKQRKMLSAYPPPIQQQIIDQSIMNSYQGLFPPKGYTHGNTQGNSRSTEQPRRLSPHERVRAAAERHAREQQGEAVSPMGSNVYDVE